MQDVTASLSLSERVMVSSRDFDQPAVIEEDSPVREPADERVMGYEENRLPIGMKLLKDVEDHRFVLGVQVAGWLIGQDQFRLIDQGSGDGDPLLLAAGELGRPMVKAITQAHADQRLGRFRFVSHAVEVLGQHHVFQSRKIEDQVKLLEDDADDVPPESRPVLLTERVDRDPVNNDGPAGGDVEASDFAGHKDHYA